MEDVFKAGVRPGGPTSHYEIKVLVCYVLSGLGLPMRFAQLHEALQEAELVNYFELIQAVEGLVKTGHLLQYQENAHTYYRITEIGGQAKEEFGKTLPFTVRQKALAQARRILRRAQRESEVRIETREVDGGYYMDLSIPEGAGAGKLVAFTVFLPNRQECDRVRRNFLNDPVFIYKCVLALLTGEQDVLGELLPSNDNLF